MEKPKRCPFCGGEAQVEMNMNNKTGAYFVFVKCKVCRSVGQTVYLGTLDTRQDFDDANAILEHVTERAVLYWNRRVQNGSD